MSVELTDDLQDRTLHVAVDRAGRTWMVLEREDGSFCVYYSAAGDPPMSKRIVWDTADIWAGPPRVLLARAERAEQQVRTLHYRITDLIAALNDYGQHTPACERLMAAGQPCSCGLAAAIGCSAPLGELEVSEGKHDAAHP